MWVKDKKSAIAILATAEIVVTLTWDLRPRKKTNNCCATAMVTAIKQSSGMALKFVPPDIKRFSRGCAAFE
jgi:hypothetical protein